MNNAPTRYFLLPNKTSRTRNGYLKLICRLKGFQRNPEKNLAWLLVALPKLMQSPVAEDSTYILIEYGEVELVPS